VILSRAPRRFDQSQGHLRIERIAPVGTVHGDREQALVEFLENDFVVHEVLLSSLLVTPSFRDGPKDQTRNLEIPGSMLRIAPE
jgi:hypothetical protein